MGEYSMRSYFQQMPIVGKPLVAPNAENEELVRAVEEEIRNLIFEAQSAGRSDESLNESGQLTAMQRIELV